MKLFKVRNFVAAGLLMSPCLPLADSDGVQIDLPDSLLTCMDQFDAMPRLTCYDQEMARLTSSTKQIRPAATEDANASDSSEVADTAPEERLGNSNDMVRQQPRTGGKPQRAELTATILNISERPYGEMIVSLDNGQVWVEKMPSQSFRVNVGDTITIRQGRFGGYRLFGRGNKSTEVKRIQ